MKNYKDYTRKSIHMVSAKYALYLPYRNNDYKSEYEFITGPKNGW